MKILITGATGFIGQHLAPALLGQNHEVAILVRDSYAAGQLLPARLRPLRPHLQLVYADLRNLTLTVRAVAEAQPEAVIHLAAAGPNDPFLAVDTALRHNVNGAINLARACFEKNGGVERLVVARTPGEKNSMNVYAASKAAAWNFCQMYAHTRGWLIYGAMIFQAFGPGQPQSALIPAALAAARAGEDFPMTSGEQRKDWIYVADVAEGLARLAVVGVDAGITVELGTGRGTRTRDVVQQIYDLVGRGGRPRPGLLPDRPGEDVAQIADQVRTLALLAWQPTYTLSQGLSQLLIETG